MLNSLFIALAVSAALITSTLAPDWAQALPFGKKELKTIPEKTEIQKLDETALRKNALERLVKAIRDQNPDAQGLDQLTIDSMAVKKSIPVKAGEMDLWMVKLQFKNPEAEDEQNFGNVELVMLVDSTGTFQLPDIFKISDGTSPAQEPKRAMNTLELNDDLGDLVITGQGAHNVIFVSDNFCPFCQKAYSFLTENLQRIAELRIVHMPMPGMHPTATIASIVMNYGKEVLAPERFSDMVAFAYSGLEPGERILAGRERKEGSPITNAELLQMEQDVVDQFLAKFPELANGRDAQGLHKTMKDKYGDKVDKEARDISKRLNVRGTPLILIDGYAIRGFNKPEIQKALEAGR